MMNRLAPLFAFFVLLSALLGSCGGDEAPPAPPTPANTTASIAGSVVVPDGIEGHSIMVFAEGTSFMALSDSAGKFEISGLKPGTYVIRAARPDLLSQAFEPVEITPSSLALPQPFITLAPLFLETLDPSQAGPAQFASRTRGILRGTVATQIPGDEMGVAVEIEQTGLKTRVLEDGTFEIINIEPGDYSVRLSRPAYADISVPVTIKAGETANLAGLRLMSAASSTAEEGLADPINDRVVFGVVDLLTADGNTPSDFSSVRIVLEGTSFSASPDPAGRFEIRNIPPGNYSVAANAPGYILDRKVPVSLRSLAAAEITLSLIEDTTTDADAGSLVGRIVFDEAPAGGSAGVSVSVGGTSLAGYTDGSGFYSILNVPEGSYELTATMVGYKPARAAAVVRRGPEPSEVADILLERDLKRPEVVSTNPAPGATDVTILQPTRISLQFNMPMNARSVEEAIRIVPNVGIRVTAQGGMAASVFLLEMDAIPAGSGPVVKFDTRYRVTIVKSATSSEGVAMERDFSMDFTTGSAEVIATSPADGDSGVLLRYDSPIAFYFNAAIDQSTISIDEIDITPDLPAGKGQIYFRRDQTTGWTVLYFAGVGDWETSYRVELAKGAETMGGDRVKNLPYRFSFTSNKPVTFQDRYGLNDPGYSERDRERERRP